MTFGFIRVLFVLICTVVGFQLGSAFQGFGGLDAMIGALVGAAVAASIIGLENVIGKVSLRGLSAAVFGLLFALIVSKFLSGAIDLVPQLDVTAAATLKLVLVLILSYLGMVFAMRGRDEFNLIIPYVKFDRQDQRDDVLILDTSVIIDGRVLDVCQTKFLEGRFIVPRFVLKELQQVADSQDSLKRNRGRRGLDILNKLRKNPHISVKIHEEDFSDIHSVDEKLVKLAKVLSGKILTNDFNLNKVAEFQGVTILNVNELANALRPVVLPGETLEVKLIKEGKEYDQAIGYLDDGTMVVVDHAKRHLGGEKRVVVSSVLQTAAGRMIFAKLESDKTNAK
ncbi:MAG: PIN domain nuclease [Candidatus Omnitrophica bacterium]|nr:PIN domain nuclease [Candidatus Omnitrophota bacterium]